MESIKTKERQGKKENYGGRWMGGFLESELQLVKMVKQRERWVGL